MKVYKKQVYFFGKKILLAKKEHKYIYNGQNIGLFFLLKQNSFKKAFVTVDIY